jgi:hypothetical protein
MVQRTFLIKSALYYRMLRMFVYRWQLHFSLPINVHLQGTFEVHSQDGRAKFAKISLA